MHWLILLLLLPYLCLLLRIFSGLSRLRPFQKGEINTTSLLSVIIPCRNEAENLPLLLADIARQTVDYNSFELIVVDDNSFDATFRIASGFSEIRNNRVIRNRGDGKKHALRTGIEASSGEYILTIDADCRITENWFHYLMSFRDKTRAQMIICPVMLESGKGFFQKFQELEFLSLQGITAGSASMGDPLMCNGAGLAFSREAYSRHYGELHFELASGDDVFLLHGIKKEDPGHVSWMEAPGAAVVTRLSGSLKSYIFQRARWISKTSYYSDRSAKTLALVTLITALIQLVLLIGGLFSYPLLLIFAAWFILKSIPDFLILRNTCARYNRKELLKWFIPSQFIYPFYVLVIFIISLSPGRASRF